MNYRYKIHLKEVIKMTNTNKPNYFNKEVLAQEVYEYLYSNDILFEDVCDGYSVYLYDVEVHHEVFNTSYFYVYTSEAIEALEEYGTFKAIGEVQRYEKDNFGEVSTELSNPCDVANMLVYILGEEVVESVQDELWEWYNELEEEIQEDEKGLQQQFMAYCKNKA